MKQTVMEFLVYVGPFFFAALSTELSELWQRIMPWFDRQKPMVKRVAIAAVVFVLYKGGMTIGVKLVPDEWLTTLPDGLPDIDFGAGLSGLLTYVFHLGDKAKPGPTEVDPGA